MQWAGLSSPATSPAPTPAAWVGRRPRTARWSPRPPRRVVLAAAASSSSSSSSPDANSNSPGSGGGDEERGEDAAQMEKAAAFLMRSQKYAMLKQQLAVAAQFEDYKEAARLRDSLKSFEEEEPVLRLRRLLKKAVEEERFEDAAKYRDELKILAPHSLLRCSSDATTLGIRVQVRSVYIESRSQPLKGQFFFAYRIRITNNSQRPIQLLRRHWIVTDANGRTENIWGVGVVGEQPVIFPKTGFEYSSACPLNTPNGRMHIDKAGSSTFKCCNCTILSLSRSLETTTMKFSSKCDWVSEEFE
uniref:ApaG domain-containing protein n=1 Tax=Leersia perrieri TaxID=77586 RepID=A0A0D9WDA7_9ORYZ